MEIQEDRLLRYACEKFEEEKFEEALEAFVLAYSKGCEMEWVLDNIYRCYMAGNEAAFREAYGKEKRGISYENCLLDFIPYREGEYFIFDKELCIFRGRVSAVALCREELDDAFRDMEFSGAALTLNWDLREWGSFLAMAGERETYLVCRDAKRCLSFWKIPELQGVLGKVTVFCGYREFQMYFHGHTSVYLPRIFMGDEREKLAEIWADEHTYRMTPAGRNTDNVLLSIAIPTYHRGNLLLKRLERLLALFYDAEIEIAVSKDGSGVYEEEYTKAGQIEDARLFYYDQGRELKGYENFHHVVEMSKGMYAMLLSDEDDVVPEALEHYLRLLKDHPELSIVRAGSKGFYSFIKKREYGTKGVGAFELMFLMQNYISGLIMRRKDFVEEDFLRKQERFSGNPFYIHYTHEWWCAALCRRGDAVMEPVVLIEEGKSAGQGGFPPYSTYEARLEQFWGMVEFLHYISDDDMEWCTSGLADAIFRTGYLFEMAREYLYDCEHYESMLEKYAFACMEAIDEFPFTREQKGELLNHLKKCYIHALAYSEQGMSERKAEKSL